MTKKLVFKTDNSLMQVKSVADCSMEHSAVLLSCIRLPHGFKTFVLSIFEWLLKTGFTVPSLENGVDTDFFTHMCNLLKHVHF